MRQFNNNELIDQLTLYAEGMAHNQRGLIANLMLVAQMHQEVMPQLIKICQAAQRADLPDAALIDETQLQLLNTSVTIETQVINAINNMIDSNLASIRRLTASKDSDVDTDIAENCIGDNIAFLVDFVDTTRQCLLHIDIDNFTYYGSSTAVNQVLTNLLDNALYQIKQNNAGKIFITTAHIKQFNVLCFKDTAGGATDDVIHQMFNKHYTTKGENGHGIGLSFCKQIMQDLGGDIVAKSIAGKFMEFTLKFPEVQILN